jgi:transglutaminase-like putative cysteine protease
MMQEIRAIGLFAFSCLIAAVTSSLPVWLIILCIVGVALKFWRNVRLPSALLYSLIVLGFSYLVWEAPRFWHRNTACGAFALATLVYVLSPPHKHRIMRFHAGLFSLLVSVLIVPSGTYPLPIYLMLTLLLCVSLIVHHAPSSNALSWMSLAKTVGKLAFPLALVLAPVYYFFPQIQEPIRPQSMSGMANELEPGRISSLALSNRLAFRAKFLRAIPPRNQLYWRADVFEEGKDLRWTRGNADTPTSLQNTEPHDRVAYELMLDSELNGLVPALEQTSSLTTHDGFEISLRPKLGVYRSTASYVRGGAEISDRFNSTEPPVPHAESKSLKVTALVKSIKGLDPKRQINELLKFYRSFHYTLTPGPLNSTDKLEEFLFDSRKGYCEHFAGSFATIMRLAGTPARVVVGFVGGSQLGNTSYFQVTNRSAHAWAEVYYEGAWHRVDPSSVAIGAEELGMGEANPMNLVVAWVTFHLEYAVIWFKEWADDLGAIWIGLGVLAVGLLSLQIYRVTHRKVEIPIWEKRMSRVLRALESKGYHQQTGETVTHFLKRVDPKLSRLAETYSERKFGENIALTSELYAQIKDARARIRSFPRLKSDVR